MPPILIAWIVVHLGVLAASLVEFVRILIDGGGLRAGVALLAVAFVWVPLVWLIAVPVVSIQRRSGKSRAETARGVADWALDTLPASSILGIAVFVGLRLLRGWMTHPALAAALAAILAMTCAPIAWTLGHRLSARARAVVDASPHPLRWILAFALICLGSAGAVLATDHQVVEGVPWGLFAVAFAGIATALAALAASTVTLRRLGVAAMLASATFVIAGASAATDPGVASDFAARLRGPGLTKLTAKIASLASDWDGDGVGALLGESDCAPADPKIFPGAVDIPGNGIDENCSGADTAPWRAAPDQGLALEISPSLQDMNIVLITIDTLRSDHTGFGGYKRPTTPNLDRLAAASATFTHLEANSAGTRSAFPSIFTGLPFYEQIPCAGDVYPPKGGWHTCTLHPGWPTLGERIASAGFQTSAVVSHRYLDGWGLERGFQTFQAASQAQVDRDMTSGQDVTALAVQELERLRAQRFFLWVHYFEPHRNYVRHEGVPDFGEEPVDLYDSEIAKTDSYIGLLLSVLAKTHLDSRTIVIVTSDHGEEFLAEHGGTDHTWALYDTSTKLPLIVHVPGGPAFRYDDPVSQLDLLPTILHLAGARKSVPPLEGRTLAPSILTSGPPPAGRPVFGTIDYPRSQTSVSVGKHKLIVDHGGAPAVLYDRSRDPLNQKDIAAEHPEITAHLRELLEAWRFHALSRGAELRGSVIR